MYNYKRHELAAGKEDNMFLTGIEKETVIVFNETEKTAYIETPNARYKKILNKLKADYPDDVYFEHDENEDGFIAAQIPKKWVKLRGPRVLTDEQKAAYSERAKKMAAARFGVSIEPDEEDEEN